MHASEQMPSDETAQSINFYAASLVQDETLKMLAALGWSLMLVYFEDITEGPPRHPVLNHGHLQEKLGRELEESKAGQYEATFYHAHQHWYFYRVSDIALGVRTLIAGLERRGLAKLATIFTVEDTNTLFTWFPEAEAGKQVVFKG
jgi:hypothetical protein